MAHTDREKKDEYRMQVGMVMQEEEEVGGGAAGVGGECVLGELRKLPELVSNILEVPSVRGRACTYGSPWETGRV